jgi:Ca-activated chloride channel family protein
LASAPPKAPRWRRRKGGFLKDAQGGILVPRLDGASLKDFAEGLGWALQPNCGWTDDDLRDLGLLDGPKQMRSLGQTVQTRQLGRSGILAVAATAVAGCLRRASRLGAVPAIADADSAAQLCGPGQSDFFQNLWRRPDQQGQHLLERHRPAEAARHFENVQWQGHCALSGR